MKKQGIDFSGKRFTSLFKALLVLLICGVQLESVSAQFGIRAGIQSNKFNDLNEGFRAWGMDDQMSVLSGQTNIGLDYFFRLKTRRIEFYPEIFYGRISDQNFPVRTWDVDLSMAQFGFDFNTHFYLLDFQEDCDCPTFSKKGKLIEKGFFLSLNPGIGYFDASFARTEQLPPMLAERFEDSGIFLKLGFGAGLDIGISDLITITPMITANYYPSLNWGVTDGFQPILGTGRNYDKTSNFVIEPAIRIGFRPDYGRGFRRR